MNKELIQTPKEEGFAKLKRSGDSSGLPTDILSQANRRLQALALIYATVYFIATYLIPQPRVTERTPTDTIIEVFGLLFILSSLALYLALKYGWVGTRATRNLAIAFEVIGAVGIEIEILGWDGDVSVINFGPSWTAVWIIIFPLLVPTAWRTTCWTATLAASVRPLMLALVAFRGIPMPGAATLIAVTLPTYLCVGIATVAAHVIYGLGKDVAKARQMGSYSLTEKLGVGGMGEVWKAEHRMLARPAAIKLVRSDITGESSLVYPERFEREVQATAQLQSPHTIAVYDYGITEGGSFYYVMELLDGLDLEHLVRFDGPLPVERTVHILRQACHSLSEAHRKGMVHRDIKPANIFLCRYAGDVDFVKVLDFGLVKRGPSMDENEVMLTTVGTFTGTPAYASPEMAGGDTDRVDARSDIYSLGCVGFWLLTGRTVFEASNTLDMLFKHRTEVPIAPSEYCEFDIPAELDAVILKCLEKQPSNRIASAAGLSAKLHEIEQSSPWDADHARRWWDARRPSESERFTGTPGPAEGDGDQDFLITKSF